MARLRHRDKWLDQAQVLSQGLSIHAAAQALDVAPSTAFRWRHRFLVQAQRVKAGSLMGIAEADETFILRSSKGQRPTGRQSRRRGGKSPPPAGRQTITSPYWSCVTDPAPAPTSSWSQRQGAAHRCAAAGVGTRCRLVHRREFSAGCRSAPHRGPTPSAQHDCRPTRARTVAHPERQRVSRPAQRMDAPLPRCGLATSYLASDLGWFRALDRSAPTGLQPACLLALALGRSVHP